jgi:cyclic pyranopterin phosphate synthase
LVSNFSTTRTTAWKSSIFFASEKVLTHTDSAGNAKMIDISGKETTSRVAVATSRVSLGAAAFELVLKNKVEKGDVLAVAKIAGIKAAKQTHLLIPLCHSIMLSDIEIHLLLNQELHAIDIRSTVKTMGQTGVEMEALVGASVSSLAVDDMCKGVPKGITIEYTRLEEKTGGASGAYSRSV